MRRHLNRKPHFLLPSRSLEPVWVCELTHFTPRPDHRGQITVSIDSYPLLRLRSQGWSYLGKVVCAEGVSPLHLAHPSEGPTPPQSEGEGCLPPSEECCGDKSLPDHFSA